MALATSNAFMALYFFNLPTKSGPNIFITKTATVSSIRRFLRWPISMDGCHINKAFNPTVFKSSSVSPFILV